MAASVSPSLSPSNSPSLSPSKSPSKSPSLSPSASLSPSLSPSDSPSASPSIEPPLVVVGKKKPLKTFVCLERRKIVLTNGVAVGLVPPANTYWAKLQNVGSKTIGYRTDGGKIEQVNTECFQVATLGFINDFLPLNLGVSYATLISNFRVTALDGAGSSINVEFYGLQ